MATRRMFSLQVVDTDFFLEMPSTARLLYYDLGVRADDDGFISPMKVVRMTGATGDDLKILIAKGFAHIFEDGVIVLLHWLRNNKIDASKYTPSIYIARLRALTKEGMYIGKLKPNRPKLALEAGQKGSRKGPQKGPEKGPEKDPQYSIGKDSIDKDTNTFALSAWESIVGTTLRSKIAEQEAAASRLRESLGAERVKELLMAVRILRGDKHAPRNIQIGITNYVSMEKHLESLETYAASKTDQRSAAHKNFNVVVS